MTRRQFSREFKIDALRSASVQGAAVVQAALDLDLSECVLRHWMRELATGPGSGQMRTDLAESVIPGSRGLRAVSAPWRTLMLRASNGRFPRKAHR